MLAFTLEKHMLIIVQAAYLILQKHKFPTHDQCAFKSLLPLKVSSIFNCVEHPKYTVGDIETCLVCSDKNLLIIMDQKQLFR